LSQKRPFLRRPLVMKNIIILLAVAFIISCKMVTPSGSENTVSYTPRKDESKSPPPEPVEIPRISKTFPLPKVHNIVQIDVWRESGIKDANNFEIPPYSKVFLNHLGFNQKPKVGRKVTVVPLEVDIAPIDLKILKATEREDPCTGGLPHYWEIEPEPITQKEFFEVPAIPNRREDIPFDVCVIYPAVEFARQIKREQLTKEMVPVGITIKTVTAAIDLTNDQKPDILIAKYCCGDSTKPYEECDSTCGKYFKKVKDKWELVEKIGDC
jgi:hypothetical protein